MTPSHSLLLRSRATRPPGRLSECWRGSKGRAARAPSALPGAAACRNGANTRTFGFPSSSSDCPAHTHPALRNPGASGSLPHSPSSNRGEERRRGRGRGSFLCCLRRPGRAQARAGATGSARAGERALAPSPAPVPALPAAWPFPFLWVPVKPRPETSAEHHGICADASR